MRGYDLGEDEMITVPNSTEGNDDLVTLKNGASVSLRFAVKSLQYLLHLKDSAPAEFKVILTSINGKKIEEGDLRNELLKRGFANANGVLQNDFLNVLAASVWEIKPGHVELTLPISSEKDEKVHHLWDREVERYEAELLSRYCQQMSEDPDLPPNTPLPPK
jgi:hypothetical protein